MNRVKYANKVFRLKMPHTLTLQGVRDPLSFKMGEEFHIVADVLYMQGFPLPPALQTPVINWIESNPSLFIDDTRIF